MNIISLLQSLGRESTEAVKGLKLPTVVQKGDTKIIKREPEIHLMRLPKSSDVYKIAPYIIVQFLKSVHKRVEPPKPYFSADIRFVFCVYGENEEEGALSLLNVMAAVRTRLLKAVVIPPCFTLDPDIGLEEFVYPDGTAPYFGGEMVGTFHLPPIEQEVNFFEEKRRYDTTGLV